MDANPSGHARRPESQSKRGEGRRGGTTRLDRGGSAASPWRQRWLAAANPSKWPKSRSNDHDPCGSRAHADRHDPCDSRAPTEPHDPCGSPTRAPTARRHQRLRSPERSVRRTWARWAWAWWAWAWWAWARWAWARWGLDRAGLGCRLEHGGLRGFGCRMDRDGQRERGCRMDRGRYCGFSATLTDSPLPTSVVSRGEPALPLSGKSPRRKLLVVAFTPLCSDSRVVWQAHLGLHPLRNLTGFTAWDGRKTTAGLRRKPSTCSQGLAS